MQTTNRQVLAAAAIAFTLGGCATVFKSKTESVNVTSNTPGAAVTVDGKPAGVTPTAVEVPTQGDAMIVVANAGRQDICRLVSHASTTWVVADIFLTSGLGLIIDWVTHAWNELPPECHANV